MRSKWPRNFGWRSLGWESVQFLPTPPLPSARGTRGNRMPQGPHTRPLFPLGNRRFCLPDPALARRPALASGSFRSLPLPEGSLVRAASSRWRRHPDALLPV